MQDLDAARKSAHNSTSSNSRNKTFKETGSLLYTQGHWCVTPEFTLLYTVDGTEDAVPENPKWFKLGRVVTALKRPLHWGQQVFKTRRRLPLYCGERQRRPQERLAVDHTMCDSSQCAHGEVRHRQALGQCKRICGKWLWYCQLITHLPAHVHD